MVSSPEKTRLEVSTGLNDEKNGASYELHNNETADSSEIENESVKRGKSSDGNTSFSDLNSQDPSLKVD
jgi:hypothetical protein